MRSALAAGRPAATVCAAAARGHPAAARGAAPAAAVAAPARSSAPWARERQRRHSSTTVEPDLSKQWFFRQRYGLSTVPTRGQMDNHCAALYAACAADGLDPQEAAFCRGLGLLLGVPERTLDALERNNWNDSMLTRIIQAYVTGCRQNQNEWKKFLLYDAVEACWADGEYSAEEKAKVAKISELLGVPTDTVEKIEDVVGRSVAVREERVQLMGAQ
eukprot:TRINITY_DN13450_c0_g2_i1.p2 TRINITY_DN13450_c0_g2~~TRINITY_DN13450_c0_g2_i1.p2  ORF type:complete len:253 (+),score=73.00 TRINITY_DN13450_c0_g2_i1:110-760(+)